MKISLSLFAILMFLADVTVFAQSLKPLEEMVHEAAHPAVGYLASMEKFGNPQVSATVLTPDEVERVFKTLAATPNIPYQIPDDGCHARAHKMSMILEKMGITNVKIYTEGTLSVRTPRAPGGKVYWTYHVAPVVLTTSGDKLIPMALDPSLFDRPVTADEWVIVQVPNPNALPKVDYRNRFTYIIDEGLGLPLGWNSKILVSAEDELTKFMMLAKDPEALSKYREYVRIRQFDQPSALDPSVFPTFFNKYPN
jgi:hypothetical protein